MPYLNTSDKKLVNKQYSKLSPLRHAKKSRFHRDMNKFKVKEMARNVSFAPGSKAHLNNTIA